MVYNGNGGSSGWGLFQQNTNYQVLFGGVTAFGSGPATLNEWTHVALVRNSGVATLYVNGVAAGSTTSAPNSPSGGFTLGTTYNNLNSDTFNGMLDEVRIFTFPAGNFG